MKFPPDDDTVYHRTLHFGNTLFAVGLYTIIILLGFTSVRLIR